MLLPETLTKCLEEEKTRNMTELGNGLKVNALMLISQCVSTLFLSYL